MFIAPSSITTSYIDLYSTKISPQFDEVKLCFFADLYYGEYFDESRLANVIQQINKENPDIIVFGGDVFSPNATIDSTSIQTVTSYLSQLDARLGKFYITGDNDYALSTTITQIMHDAQFESIENQVIHLRNKDIDSIQLVGLSNSVNGTSDMNAIYNSLSPNEYTIAFAHTPDTSALVPSGINRMIAADSLGGLIYIPFVGGVYESNGSTLYQQGSIQLSNFTLDINNGCGTTMLDVRFNAPAQITVYRFHNGEDPNANN